MCIEHDREGKRERALEKERLKRDDSLGPLGECESECECECEYLAG